MFIPWTFSVDCFPNLRPDFLPEPIGIISFTSNVLTCWMVGLLSLKFISCLHLVGGSSLPVLSWKQQHPENRQDQGRHAHADGILHCVIPVVRGCDRDIRGGGWGWPCGGEVVSTTASVPAPMGGPTQPRGKSGLGCLSRRWGALCPSTSRCRGSLGCPEITFKQKNSILLLYRMCKAEWGVWSRGTSICVGNPRGSPGSATEQVTQTPVCRI